MRQVLGKTPTKGDVLDLREILAAFYGIAPQTASVKRLVEQQIWFDPRSKASEATLSVPRRAVLASLEAIANEQDGGKVVE